MRTKHLLWTMALTALSAACSSDDVFEAGQADQVAGRKVLENITFTLEGADTRFDRGETGWTISEGDAFGACLVDNYQGEKNGDRGAVDNYFLSEYIQTNYQYAYDKASGSWRTPARMVEGNYVFYAPFNEAHLSRKPIEVVTPVVQQLDVDKNGVVDPYSAINNVIATGNPFFVAYQFLPAENQSRTISLSLRPIFAMPEFGIKNEKTTDLTITKLVVKTNSTFPVKGDLKIGADGDVASAASDGVVGNFFNVGAEDKTNNPWGAWVNAANTAKKNLNGTTADLLDNVTNTNTIVVNIPNGMVVKAGETVKFYLVMPAAKYATGNTVYAYISEEEGFEIALGAMTMSPNKRYPNEDYLGDGTLSAKAGQRLTSKIAKATDPSAISATFPVVVSTTEELISAINNSSNAISVIATGDKVAINDDVVTAMEVGFNGMTVEGNITIEGGADAESALTLDKKVELKGETTVKGYVVLNDNTVKLANATVERGANLTITKADAASVIVNKGTLKVSAPVAKVENYGELNINGVAPTALENHATVNITKTTAISYAALEGTWNLNKDMSFVAAVTVKENAEVTVASGVKVAGAAVTVEAGATLNVNGRVDNAIKVEGLVDTVNGNKNAVVNLNDGAMIVGKLSDGNNNVTNKAASIVNVDKGATFYTDPDITKLTSVYTYNGNVTKTGDLASVKHVNLVKINGDVINAGSLANINQFANADIEISGEMMSNNALEITTAGAVKVAEGVTMNANLTLTKVTTFKVGGKLDIASSAALAATDVTTAEFGSLNSGADVTLAKVTSVKVGAISTTGSITFGAAGVSTNAVLKGNVTVSSGETITFPATGTATVGIKISGNVVLAGKIATKADKADKASITVCGNSSLTINTGSEISNTTASMLKFQSTENDADDNVITGTVVPGTVTNNGTVKGAAVEYAYNASTMPWWTEGSAPAVTTVP